MWASAAKRAPPCVKHLLGFQCCLACRALACTGSSWQVMLPERDGCAADVVVVVVVVVVKNGALWLQQRLFDALSARARW